MLISLLVSFVFNGMKEYSMIWRQTNTKIIYNTFKLIYTLLGSSWNDVYMLIWDINNDVSYCGKPQSTFGSNMHTILYNSSAKIVFDFNTVKSSYTKEYYSIIHQYTREFYYHRTFDVMFGKISLCVQHTLRIKL